LGKFSYEAIAKGVPKDKLFQWYTDFSPEDVEIMKRRGEGRLLSRNVTREGNKLHIENEHLMRGKVRKSTAEAVLHPEDYTYDITSTMPGMIEDKRHYRFTEVPGQGTRIRFESNYRTFGFGMKLMDSLGLLKRLIVKGSQRTLDAYVAEAEEQLGSTSRR